MKAKDLASELIKHPDFDVEFVFQEADGSQWGISQRVFIDINIADIGHSNMVIRLCGEET